MVSNREFKRILHFLELVSDVTLNFREQVQQALKKVWGYQHSVFWFTKDDGEIFNPKFLGISDAALTEYFDCYIHHDFLHPARHLQTVPHQVLASYHLLSVEQLHNSIYYKEFMYKYNYSDEMAVNFSHNKKIIATLGILKKKGEPPFDQQDVERFESIIKIIEKKIMHYFNLKTMSDERQLIRSKLDHSKDGYILLDANYNVLYKNQAAQQQLQQVDIEEIVEPYLAMDKFEWSNAQQSYLFSLTKRDVSFDHFYKTPTYLFRIEASTNYNHHLQQLHLTAREQEVCALLIEGLSYSEISMTLFITINTVKHHVKNIYAKAQVTKVGELRRLLL